MKDRQGNQAKSLKSFHILLLKRNIKDQFGFLFSNLESLLAELVELESEVLYPGIPQKTFIQL